MSDEKLKADIIAIIKKISSENDIKTIEDNQNKIINYTKDITLIIPTYNRALVLKSDLEKGFKLGNQNKVIIDDCSNNLNRNILETLNYKKKYGIQNIIFHQQNKGVAAVLKSAFKVIDTKYVMFCGDDDIILCNNKELFSDDYNELKNNDSINLSRYVLNLNENGDLSLGYDRKLFHDMKSFSVLKYIFETGEMSAFNAGAIFKTKDAISAMPEEIFKVSEDYVMLARILGNNLNRKIKVSENYLYIRRVSDNTLSRKVNKSKLSIHLMSLIVSGYYCLKNNLVNLYEVKQYIKNRGKLLQDIYGYGDEFASLIINYISNKISLNEFINFIKSNCLLNDITIHNIPLEFINIKDILRR